MAAYQMGLASVISIVQAGNSVASSATGMKPDANPIALMVAFSRRLQGSVKPDCVTVWFLA